jgi:hypothetical protein
MKDPDEHPHSPTALLKTMAVAALLAAAVSACNKSLDKPALPQPPKPQTGAPGPAGVKHAIFSSQPGGAVFYRDGEQHRGRLVIRT